MKIKKVEPSKSVFEPICFTIELEAKKEAVYFEHLLRCFDAGQCDYGSGVKAFIKEIDAQLVAAGIVLPQNFTD